MGRNSRKRTAWFTPSVKGPCLQCMTHIPYGNPTQEHQAKGDLWLRKLYNRWFQPPKLRRSRGRHFRVNGYPYVQIVPYLCLHCRDSFKEQAQALPIEEQKKKSQTRKIPPVAAYRAFLLTKFWHDVRDTKLSVAGFKCESCKATGELHIHHLTYAHHGQEDIYLGDLVVLCRSCHKIVHGLI